MSKRLLTENRKVRDSGRRCAASSRCSVTPVVSANGMGGGAEGATTSLNTANPCQPGNHHAPFIAATLTAVAVTASTATPAAMVLA